MTLARTKLDKSNNSQATIVFFKETLPPRPIQWIRGAENVPETLSGWYKKAAFQEQNWREIQKIFGRNTQNRSNNNNNTQRKFNFQIWWDPNAMDVDVLMAEQRSDLMRKGVCFNCKAVGHLSQDCPNKKKKEESKKEENKWKGWELATYIQAQMLKISEEERTVFYEGAQDQGF